MKSAKCSCGCRSGGMFTIDRVNRLRRHFDLSQLTTVLGVDLHAALDVLDSAAKLLTRPENSQMRRSVTLSVGGHGAQWYVGARLARLEDAVSHRRFRSRKVFGKAPQPIGSEFWSAEDWRAHKEYQGAKSADESAGAFSFWLGEMG
jgi:hypothetical protein